MEISHLMGRFLKALVMTLLIMEITTIVALTAVWTSLSELHASQILVNVAVGLSALGLCVLAAGVFRRALAAESRLLAEVEPLPDVMPRGPAPDLPGPNAIGPPLSGALHPAEHVPLRPDGPTHPADALQGNAGRQSAQGTQGVK